MANLDHWSEKRVEARLETAVENKFPSVAVETADLRVLMSKLRALREQIAESREKPKKKRKKVQH